MPISQTGKLFVFEGPNGCGKTQLSRLFTEHLEAIGTECHLLAFPGREAGTLGHHVYEIHRDPASAGIRGMHPASLQALHIAAHIDQIETRILPALSSGGTVVLDRFWWSTWVYGRSAGVSEESLSRMLYLEALHWRDVLPNAVFLFECDRPFDESLSDEWTGLKLAYEILATAEQNRQQIVRILNLGTIEQALANVISCAQGEATSRR